MTADEALVTPTAPPRLGARFLVVWAGQTVSAIGTILSGVGVAVYVFVETGDATWLGLLAAASSVPYLATLPLVKLTDRFRRRAVMIGADTFAVVGPAIALALAVVGRLEIWHLAVAGFLGGVGNSFQWPAAQAAIPALVERDALDRANGLFQLGPAAGMVLGPVLATPLVAQWGIEAILCVDIATFIVAVAATTLVRFDDATVATDTTDAQGVTGSIAADDGTWHATAVWLRTAGRPLLVLLGVMAIVNFCLAFFNVALVVLATDLGGTARSGVALGAGGGAMIVGSIVAARRGVAPDRVGTFARALMMFGVGCAVAASRSEFSLVVVGVVIALVAVPAVNASVSTLFHERVPASMYGRVFGLRTAIGRALEPVGGAIAGVVVAHLAAPSLAEGGLLAGSVGRVIGTGTDRGAALVLMGVGGALGCLGWWLWRSSLRRELAPTAPVEQARSSVSAV